MRDLVARRGSSLSRGELFCLRPGRDVRRSLRLRSFPGDVRLARLRLATRLGCDAFFNGQELRCRRSLHAISLHLLLQRLPLQQRSFLQLLLEPRHVLLRQRWRVDRRCAHSAIDCDLGFRTRHHDAGFLRPRDSARRDARRRLQGITWLRHRG